MANNKKTDAEEANDQFEGMTRTELIRLSQENDLVVRTEMSDDDLRAALRGARIGAVKAVATATDDRSRFGGRLHPQAQEVARQVEPNPAPAPGQLAPKIIKEQLEDPNDRKGRASLGR